MRFPVILDEFRGVAMVDRFYADTAYVASQPHGFGYVVTDLVTVWKDQDSGEIFEGPFDVVMALIAEYRDV